jgi:hypothetical protein
MIDRRGSLPKLGQQRLQRLDVLGAHRDVGALVAAVAGQQPDIVVAVRAGVDLHDQPVVQAHAGHLGQHLGPEQLGLGRGDSPFSRLWNRASASTAERSAVAAVGWPWSDEVAPASMKAARRRRWRFQIALPAGDVLARDLGEPLEGAAEALVLEVDDRVGAIGGDHVAAPAALADGLVVLQRPAGPRWWPGSRC